MKKLYCIFDDYPTAAKDQLENAGILLDIHPKGFPRPNENEMSSIIQKYDGVIIGTSQKLTHDMFENINEPRIIATASVGLDHIQIPDNKKNLITVINTPTANAKSVAEYTFACALMCCKRLDEGKKLYIERKNNKFLSQKPGDLYGKTLGVIGAGSISKEIMNFGQMFGMNVLFWTAHPERHSDLINCGMKYKNIDQVFMDSDFISVNLPNKPETAGIISRKLITNMKSDAVFISISRLPIVDLDALVDKAIKNRDFYVCLDIDLDENVADRITGISNIQVTPHIAGGTIETRQRMFNEITEALIRQYSNDR